MASARNARGAVAPRSSSRLRWRRRLAHRAARWRRARDRAPTADTGAPRRVRASRALRRNRESGALDQRLDTRLVRRDRPRSPLLRPIATAAGPATRGSGGRRTRRSRACRSRCERLRAPGRAPAQVLAVTLREHHLDVLGVAAAGRAVERLGDLAVVEHDLAARLGHRAIRQRVLRAHSAVGLAARRGAEVEPFVDEAAELAHGVGARRHRLRLERLQAVVERRAPSRPAPRRADSPRAAARRSG